MMEEKVIFRYRTLRTFIGVIALSIPVVSLILFQIVQNPKDFIIPTTISVTYYLGARDLFVGMLFIVASFLMAYNGHVFEKEKIPIERILSIFAAVLAILVAVVPTKFNSAWIVLHGLKPVHFSDKCKFPKYQEVLENPELEIFCHVRDYEIFSSIHFGAAVFLIAILFVFCLRFLFRSKCKVVKYESLKESSELSKNIHINKIKRRVVTYYICAIGMVLTVVLGAIWYKLGGANNIAIFFVEWFCLWFFGWSWLTAGKQIPFYFAGEDVENYLSEQIDSQVAN